MTLLQQFQALVGSIFFGFIFTHLWYVFNRMFYKWEGTFKRFILEVPLFISFSYLYFLFLVNICNGKLSLYYLLWLTWRFGYSNERNDSRYHCHQFKCWCLHG